MDPEVEHIENIKRHCRNLRRIWIFGSEDFSEEFNQEISDLFASYGAQLEYCHMENMNENQLTSYCSNS